MHCICISTSCIHLDFCLKLHSPPAIVVPPLVHPRYWLFCVSTMHCLLYLCLLYVCLLLPNLFLLLPFVLAFKESNIFGSIFGFVCGIRLRCTSDCIASMGKFSVIGKFSRFCLGTSFQSYRVQRPNIM
jgi:hypothetical protein